MATIGTYCQICALPLQHDHYVPTEASGFFGVYSSGDTKNNEFEPLFQFGSSHSWLLAAVALPGEGNPKEPAKGRVDSGGIEGADGEVYFVGDGLDEYAAVHEKCWELSGRPSSFDSIKHLRYMHGWAALKKYHGQLFELKMFLEDEKAWMLEEPQSGNASYKRIERSTKEGEANRAYVGCLPLNSADEFAKSSFWTLDFTGEPPWAGLWRYRIGLKPDMKTGPLHTFIQSDHSFTRNSRGYPTGKDLIALETYETKLREELESSGKWILLLNLVNKGKMYFIGYTSDLKFSEATMQRLAKEITGQEVKISDETDPEWKIYFSEFFPTMSTEVP